MPDSFPLPERSDWSIGIVGFGGIARGAHASVWRQMGWKIVAVADPDPQAGRVAQEKFAVARTYDDFHDLVADDEVRIIDLCTHPHIREEVVDAAAAARKHVITEKPLAGSMEVCERLVHTAERSGIKLAVHQNRRWMIQNFLAHHVVRRGVIGEPFFVTIQIFGKQDVTLASHPFYSRCDDFLTIQWNNHLADLLRYWTGRDARRVFARTARMNGQNFAGDNLLVSIADFGHGLTGHILHNELLRSDLTGEVCRIDGTKGSLRFNAKSIELHSEVADPSPVILDTSGMATLPSHAGSMADFLIAVETDREPSVSGRRNLPTMRTVFAEHESAKVGGKWLDV